MSVLWNGSISPSETKDEASLPFPIPTLSNVKHLLKRVGLRPVSKRRAKVNRVRAEVVRDVLTARPRCEFEDCTQRSVHVHEPLTRARGGSITDTSNMLALCAGHHRWLHDNPAEATRLGYLKNSWEA